MAVSSPAAASPPRRKNVDKPPKSVNKGLAAALVHPQSIREFHRAVAVVTGAR